MLNNLIKTLYKNKIKVIDRKINHDGYELLVQSLADIDYPKHYKITIEELE